MHLVMIASLYCSEHVLFFIYLLEGLGIILILILEKISYDFIHTNLYLLLKNEVFPISYFTYDDVLSIN